jgi:osmotically-inducible protein OsmY
MFATSAFAEDAPVFTGNSASLVTDQVEDAEIVGSVQSRLCRSSYAPVRLNVSCDCRNGVLTLAGNLPSYFLVQVAQSVALRAPGVEQVVNRIRVG